MIAAIAESKINQLRAAGLVLTDEDVYDLCRLGAEVENPPGFSRNALFHETKIEASDGTVFHAITPAKSNFIEYYGLMFNPGEDLMFVAFALACEDTSIYKNSQEVVEAIDDWITKINIPAPEMIEIVSRLLASDNYDYTSKNKKSEEKTDIIETLVAGTGLSAEYWEKQHWQKIELQLSAIYKFAALAAGGSQDSKKQISSYYLGKFAKKTNEILSRDKNV